MSLFESIYHQKMKIGIPICEAGSQFAILILQKCDLHDDYLIPYRYW